MNHLKYLLLTSIFALGLTGCNTTRGIGQDVEATGAAIEEVAEDAKDALKGDKE